MATTASANLRHIMANKCLTLFLNFGLSAKTNLFTFHLVVDLVGGNNSDLHLKFTGHWMGIMKRAESKQPLDI